MTMETNPIFTQNELTSTQSAAPLLYDRAEVNRILRTLTDDRYFAPAYILLFGKLAGGTPHSDAAAYDLLVACHGTPKYDWCAAKRILRYTFPYNKRRINYINLYLTTAEYFETFRRPHLYFAHAEGELLYCSDRHHFRRPRRPINFTAVAAEARMHYDTFRNLGRKLLEMAREACRNRSDLRLAATLLPQAACCYYRTLYYVFHGEECDMRDPALMHERIKTLSAKLMLAFDDNHIERIFTLPALKDYSDRAAYNIHFDVDPRELELHLTRVERAVELIQEACEERIDLYRRLRQ